MNIVINLILRIHIPNDRGVRIRIIISSTSSRIVRESNNSWEWIRESLCKWLVETDPHIPHCCNCYIYIAIRLDSFLDRKKVSSVSSWDCLSTSKRGCSGGRNMDTLGPWQSTKILFAQPFQLDSILTERSKLAVFFVKDLLYRQMDCDRWEFLSFKAYIVVSDTSLLIVILWMRHTGFDVLLTFLFDYGFWYYRENPLGVSSSLHLWI
jgi:hypothetical protein